MHSSLFSDLQKPFFILAPMDDVTDTVFRQIIASTAAPDLYFTEFVNVDGLQSVGRQKLLKRLQFTKTELPLIAQIWGKTPENYYKTAKEIADGTFAKELGLPEGVNFAGIDINMGCPDKAVMKNGCCAALIDNRELALQIIEATKKGAGSLPVSVKTRLGNKIVDLSWHELLLKHKLNALTIHGRTAREMSKVPAHWDLINEVRIMRDKLSPTTKIIGNGDVLSRSQGLELAQKYKLDGIMIGRGVFHDPFIFSKNSPWATYTKQQRLELYAKHVKLFADTWHYGERSVKTLNKFCKVYIQDFPGAKELREQLMAAKSTDELLILIDRNN